jgi:hypothetical protein
LGFEVLAAASMKIYVFWIVAPYSLVVVYQCFTLAANTFRAMNK